jgi:hypothetical protein
VSAPIQHPVVADMAAVMVAAWLMLVMLVISRSPAARNAKSRHRRTEATDDVPRPKTTNLLAIQRVLEDVAVIFLDPGRTGMAASGSAYGRAANPINHRAYPAIDTR